MAAEYVKLQYFDEYNEPKIQIALCACVVNWTWGEVHVPEMTT